MANPVGTLFVNFVKMREKSPLLTIGVQCGHGLQHSERPGWDVASHIFAGLGFALLARRSSASIGRWTYFCFQVNYTREIQKSYSMLKYLSRWSEPGCSLEDGSLDFLNIFKKYSIQHIQMKR